LLTLPALGGYEEQTDEGSVGVTGPAVILHPPGRCHANGIHPSGMETFSIEFDPAWLGLDRSDALFRRSHYWIGGPVPLASRDLLRAWTDMNATEDRIQSATAAFFNIAAGAPKGRSPPWLDAVRRSLARGDAASVSEIAPIVGIHPRWLAHAYRQAAGEGLHDTIVRRRVEEATRMLRATDDAIAEIAVGAGFCDQSHLNRSLRRLTGRTPLQIRAEREQLSRLLAS